MSKRSVDKGDKGKKTPAQAQEAKPMDAPSVPLEKKAKAGSKADIWQNSDLYWYAGLILAALFSFYLRAIIPWKAVFSGGQSHLQQRERCLVSHDARQRHSDQPAEALVRPHDLLPSWNAIHFGPFISWAIAIFSYIFGLGHPSMHLVEVGGRFLAGRSWEHCWYSRSTSSERRSAAKAAA